MKKLLLVICCLCTLTLSAATTKRALVIGIGDYPESTGWAKINGDKDIPVVVDMLRKNGYPADNIHILKNEQATCAQILRELNYLVSASHTGDDVYIHFSGHGQQITDVHGDEDDGLDEAWIAYDACFAYEKGKYEGQNHILDDDLNTILRNIRTQIGPNANLTVVVDACHSGGATRAIDSETDGLVVRGEPIPALRGSDGVFRIPGTHPAYNPAEVKPIQWIMISACKAYQCNFEYQGSGSLTYALSQLSTSLRNMSCSEVLKRVKATIKQIIPFTQIPQMDAPEQQTERRFL